MSSSTPPYQQCTRCVMDTTDPDISFDVHGVCNHCHSYEKLRRQYLYSEAEGQALFDGLIREIKAHGQGKRYDCILGVSGGVDSTYMAWLAWKNGLRPLVIHLDNGWNSEIAVQNIHNIIEKTGFDLYTHVINWEEFRDLQLSFLRASVIDLELTSDHAISSLIYYIARKYGIRYLMSGFNVATEGILPQAWRWSKFDWLNIKAIHKLFGKVPLKTFPRTSFWQKTYFDLLLRLRTVQILNYLPYDKAAAKATIMQDFGWRDYGGKHYESIITRFYQGYILPVKFNVDKRKAHLSTLINSGQLSKTQALAELEQPVYDPQQLEIDREFVIKKFGLDEAAFQAIMEAPIVPHTHYPSYETRHYRYHERFFEAVRPLTQLLKKLAGRPVSTPQSQTT
ncbi:MAG: N-acetyl sugar amidotransferase [Bacteroidia bacterium]|nr:N-acetyl sugar amidotransferase [Bacteroidia bacterium]